MADPATVTIQSGANESEIAVGGQTVGAVRSALSEILNIPAGAVATVNGERASEDQVLAGGDSLSFKKELAEKGN